jgi:hypothetical protein
MQPRNFVILAGVTAVSVALAVFAIVRRDLPVTTSVASEPLFPGLLERVNEVRAVRLEGEGRKLTVEAADGAGGWRLVEKGGYPVEAEEVRDLVLGLANLQLVEAKTAQPERLKRLELEEPGGAEAKSRRIELLGADGKPLAAAVVGKTRPGLYGGGRSGVYVRRAGDNQAWLAAGALELPHDALSLLDQEIIDIPADRVARITLDAGGSQPLVLHRPDAKAESFTVEATLPEGREIDKSKVELLSESLAGLRMEDVKPASEVPVPPDARRARVETFDGLQVDVTLVKLSEGDAAERWVQLAVAPRESAAAPPPAQQAPMAEGAAAAPAAEEAPPEKSPAERAQALASRVQGWAFKIPPYLADRLGGGLDGLLADQPGAS